jgi:hypothetical protein
VLTTLNDLNAPNPNVIVGSNAGAGTSAPTAMDDTHIKRAVYTEYLNKMSHLLKQGYDTSVAIENTYGVFAQDGFSLTILDPVKQQVIDLLSN